MIVGIPTSRVRQTNEYNFEVRHVPGQCERVVRDQLSDFKFETQHLLDSVEAFLWSAIDEPMSVVVESRAPQAFAGCTAPRRTPLKTPIRFIRDYEMT